MFVTEPSVWAQTTFQQANLGDIRRTKRLMKLGKSKGQEV
jgi:hypothetical protein